MSMKYNNIVILPPTERSLWFYYIYIFSQCKRPCKYLGFNIFGKCKSVCNTQCIMIRLAKARSDLARNSKTVGLFGCIRTRARWSRDPEESSLLFASFSTLCGSPSGLPSASLVIVEQERQDLLLHRWDAVILKCTPDPELGRDWREIPSHCMNSNHGISHCHNVCLSSSTTTLSGLSWRLCLRYLPIAAGTRDQGV